MTTTDIILIAGFAVTTVSLLLTRGKEGPTGPVGPMGMMGAPGRSGCDCC